MSTDANTLLAESKCYLCLGISLAEALQLALLNNISNSGVNANILSGHGSPVGVVTPTTSTAIYFDEDTGAQYNFYAGAWH